MRCTHPCLCIPQYVHPLTRPPLSQTHIQTHTPQNTKYSKDECVCPVQRALVKIYPLAIFIFIRAEGACVCLSVYIMSLCGCIPAVCVCAFASVRLLVSVCTLSSFTSAEEGGKK